MSTPLETEPTRDDGAGTTKARKNSLTHRLYTGEVSFEFVRRWKTWFLVSGLLLALSLGALGFRGLDLGIEFRGGADFSAPAAISDTTVQDYREAVDATGLPDLEGTQVLTVGNDTVRVQTRSLTAAEVPAVRSAIAKEAGTTNESVTYSLIGASWGKQITNKAIQALVVFVLLVMAMIWAYFRDWKMSIAAIVALLHDLILTVGVYALAGFTVTPATLTGVLTILGYSLYDTVVVFDKVKENVQGLTSQNRSYTEAANTAVNQVLVRSLNTTLIGVIPVAALLAAGLFWLHGGPLVDLGLALFVGMVAGAYSSIFIATPLLALLKEREPGMKAHRERLARRSEKARGRAKIGDATAAVAGDTGVASAPVGTAPLGTAPLGTLVGDRRQPPRSTRANRKK